jgi:adenylate cyclase
MRRRLRQIWDIFAGRGRLAGLVVLLGLLVIRAWNPAIIETVSLRYFDLLQRLEPRVESNFPVLIVDIDEKSLAEIGQWPWPRTELARIVDKLTASGAVTIGFDVVFPEPDRTSPGILAKQLAGAPSALVGMLNSLPSHDIVFANSLRRSRVVLGEVAVESGGELPVASTAIAKVGGDPTPFLFHFQGLIANIETLRQAALGHGSVSLAPDVDDVVRRVPGIVRVGDVLHPALGIDMLRVATGQRAIGAKVDAAGVNSLIVANVSIPTDEHGRIWVHYTAHDERRFVSAADVLKGRVDPRRIAGKLVILGTSAAGLRDIKTVPVAPTMPGVEVQAQLLETILAQDHLRRPNYALGLELAVVLGVGLLLLILVPRLGATWTIIVPVAVGSVMVASSVYAYSNEGFLLDPTYPTVSVLLIYLALAYVGYITEERARKEVKFAFGHYVSPIVVDRLARDRSMLRLGGEKRDLSIMFCDLRGFTTISERFKDDPEGLTLLINRFLNAVSKAVRSFEGTLDKYIGDSMMAFWNAPLADAAHARNACRAALAMQVAMQKLNAELAVETGAGSAPAEEGAAGPGDATIAAIRRIEAAARRGVPQAQYQLGKLYRDGIGRAANLKEAIRWFRAAAEQGDPRAQRNLGSRYSRGDGVARNDREALFWLTLAAQRDLETAAEERRQLETRMHGAEIAEIEERVRVWEPKPAESGSIQLEMGVGINSGGAVVGNMGSDFLFNYSVIGDAVNLASRLESQTRNYGVGVLVSESTATGADGMALIEVDLIAVKGKQEAVRVFGLLGDEAMAAQPAFGALVAANKVLLDAYRAQNWAAARAAAKACLEQEIRLDELYDLYLQRIAIYEREPPGPEWNGVFYAQTK